MKKYRKYLFAFIVLAGVLMLITLCAGCMADKIIFQPRPDLYPELDGVEMLALENSGNIALKYTPPAQEDGLIFLHCHGNAENCIIGKSAEHSAIRTNNSSSAFP